MKFRFIYLPKNFVDINNTTVLVTNLSSCLDYLPFLSFTNITRTVDITRTLTVSRYLYFLNDTTEQGDCDRHTGVIITLGMTILLCVPPVILMSVVFGYRHIKKRFAVGLLKREDVN